MEDLVVVMRKLFNKKTIFCIIGVVLFYAIVSVLFLNGVLPRSIQSLLTKICYYIILAISLNLIVGFLGELSLGHAGFYAVGAYTGCLVATKMSGPIEVKFIVGVIVGGICAAIMGFIVSSSILKLRGDYLAIVTLAIGEFIRSIVKIIPGFGGTKGIIGVPSFDTKYQAFSWSFLIMVISYIIITNFVKSRHGRAVMAIRDNSIAAQSLGININKYKVLVFTFGAFFAGMAGVLFGFFKTSVEPGDFTYNVSIEILVMVVLGGMGSLKGSTIAACIIVALPELLRETAQYRLLIYAIALIVMMMLNSSDKFNDFKKAVSEKVIGFRKALFKPKKKSEEVK